MKEEIIQKLQLIVKNLTGEEVFVALDIPTDLAHGDFTTNIAFAVSKKLGISPREAASQIKEAIEEQDLLSIEKVEVAGAGFINFWVDKKSLLEHVAVMIAHPEKAGTSESLQNKKIMVEYAHPNTHKEMHIGHMRTLITGEAIARILTANGATVFRANYQGDIGPHVAKALYGIEKIMQEKQLTLDQVEEWSNKEKAHFLGEGYVRGSQDYEAQKIAIDTINTSLYQQVPGVLWDLYQATRKWSLDYYDEFYERFYTRFDHLFLESDMFAKGKAVVEDYVGSVFVKDPDGSIIFPGEKYGLHTRVFVTKLGNPTYEGKEMGNAFTEWEVFHFDKKIHVVASEQAGYFHVVFKALDLIDPAKFAEKQLHLSMGMVQLTDRKMSSRTGDVLTVDWLLDEIKATAATLFSENKIMGDLRAEVLEKVTIGSLKYSVLKGGVKQDVAFDIKTSVSLDGNSGPYLQYTFARTQSILAKVGSEDTFSFGGYAQNELELGIIRKLNQFTLVVQKAAESLAPSTICTYLYELAKQFNLFYQTYRIADAKNLQEREFRLFLTTAVGVVLGQGLLFLGIEAPKSM